MQRHNQHSVNYSLILFLLLSGLVLPVSSVAQERLVPLNKTFDLYWKQQVQKSSRIHSAFQPISESDLNRSKLNSDSLLPFFSLEKRKEYSLFRRKVFHEHLFILDTQKVKLTLDPLYQFEYMNESNSSNNPLFKNSRGFVLQLQIADNFAVGSSFLENQARLPSYIANRVDQTDVAYGQGRVKTLDSAYYDFAMSSAYLTYSPIPFLNITLGHGKHFIGSGYRSHLLSDLSFNYPYFKLRTNWLEGKIQYQNLYTLFQDLNRVPSNTNTEQLFERQTGAIHYLSFLPHANLEIGLFEANTWTSLDSSGRHEPPLSAYVPIIFLNSFLEESNYQSSSNVGLNLSFRPGEKMEFFSQLSSRDINEGLTSFQLGMNYFLIENFRIGLELNSQNRDSTLSYFHYNESLSLPYSSEVQEWIVSGQYVRERWSLLGRSNIFQGDFDQIFVMGELSYMINPSVNSNVYLNVTHRDVGDLLLISFGWRTSLQNLYFNY